MDMKKTGDLLKELRKGNGLTQEQLGEKLGVTGKTVSRWETGVYMPPIECLKLLSEIYGITINELVAGERLSEESFKQAAEENIAYTYEKMEINTKRIERFFSVILFVSVILGTFAVFCLPEFYKLDRNDKIREIIVTVCVILLVILSNTQNLIGRVLNGLISDKGNKDK